MKHRVSTFVLGVVVGAVIFGGGTALAASIIAAPRTASIVVDGQFANVEGYLIPGNHFFMLRDVSEALKGGGKDFDIQWNGKTNQILIQTDKGYTPEVAPSPSPTAPPTVTPAPGQNSVFANPPASVMTKAGDVIKTPTGDYEITKGKTEWQKETVGAMFPYPGEPALPTVNPDWKSIYPDLTYPTIPVERKTVSGNDVLIVFNPHETQRMILTAYKIADKTPACWYNGKTALKFEIILDNRNDNGLGFWPFRESEVEKQITTEGNFAVYAMDVYSNGRFNETSYFLHQ